MQKQLGDGLSTYRPIRLRVQNDSHDGVEDCPLPAQSVPRCPKTKISRDIQQIWNVSNLCVKHSILAWLRLNKWKSQMISLRVPTNTRRRRNVKCVISCDVYGWRTNKSPRGRRNLGIACGKKNMGIVEEAARDNVHVAVSFKSRRLRN